METVSGPSPMNIGVAWDEHGEGISTRDAAARLGVSVLKIQAACRAYRYRQLGMVNEQTPPDPLRADPDPLPRPHEMACTWNGTGHRLTYFINEAYLDWHFINRGEMRRRGRPASDARGAFVAVALLT